MSSDRRGFLRGLATLPLLGGSVALIGKPFGVDIIPSTGLRDAYLGWLRLEHCRVMHECTDGWVAYGGYQEHSAEHALPESPAMIAAVKSMPIASRAALVLSTVGIDWRTVERDCDGLADRPNPSRVTWRDPFRTYPTAWERKYGQPYVEEVDL